MSKVEQPAYRVVMAEGTVEIRDYGPTIVAETEVRGKRAAALGVGFRVIAGFIFGANVPKAKIAMTAPVEQRLRGAFDLETLAVADVDPLTWTVRFFMPRGSTIETLPQPNDPKVRLVALAPKRVAVIRFSGLATEETLRSKTNELRDFMSKHKLQSAVAPAYAFYNPPWTLPFLRRNEITFDLAFAAGTVE